MSEIYKSINDTITAATEFANELAKTGIPWRDAEIIAARKYGFECPEAGLPNIESLACNGLTPCCTDDLIVSSRKPYGHAEFYPRNNRKLNIFSQRRTRSGNE
jgi:hypothetical protein